MANKSILATITGELFQPVRLHYRVLDAKGPDAGIREASILWITILLASRPGPDVRRLSLEPAIQAVVRPDQEGPSSDRDRLVLAPVG